MKNVNIKKNVKMKLKIFENFESPLSSFQRLYFAYSKKLILIVWTPIRLKYTNFHKLLLHATFNVFC